MLQSSTLSVNFSLMLSAIDLFPFYTASASALDLDTRVFPKFFCECVLRFSFGEDCMYYEQ